MPTPTFTQPRAIAATTAAIILTLGISACSSTASSGPSPTISMSAEPGKGLPSTHVHGLSVNSETGQILLATHEGLFDVSKNTAVKIGPTNDLMGFTAAMDQGVFYASGHPGQDSDLPNPVGLLRSTDGGVTWEQLSRQGESDFHTLATTKSGIVAYDGTLQTSTDGKSWQTATAGFVPAVLAGNPYSDTVLATTPQGLQRSADAGKTWALNVGAPVLQFAAFATATEAVGVTPDGTVYISSDAGTVWNKTGTIDGEIQAIAASEGAEGRPWIWAATTTGLAVSTDGGVTFRPADAD
ncbi:exo-alpha-sialidase [Paenarthrobacter sp. CC6]|uniref:F510_1955 family glycosylhydrolase n=1 Tax=Paenarthrobacter sp. CC6 TaxID=3029184 RepID=UPI00339C8AC0